MPKPTSGNSTTGAHPRFRVVLITLDHHLSATVARAQAGLQRKIPGAELAFHVATDWAKDEAALKRCHEDIAAGDLIIVTMLFMEDHVQAVLPALQARRESCDAMVCCMSAAEIVRLTRIGKFKMGANESGAVAFLKKLRGSKKDGSSDGAKQMAMLRRLPRILRFIPGTAQDLRSYFLTMQYWLASSDRNLLHMFLFLIDRYASGPRAALKGTLKPQPPVDYPDTGLYHPDLATQTTEDLSDLPCPQRAKGTIGLVLMRAYVLAGDTAHYDGVIRALETKGFRVLPIFACGLDIRPAAERYFLKNGQSQVDAVVSLTGFSLVGGPAYCNPGAAEEMLAALDVPYVSAQALEFQSLDDWQASDQGLLPVEATMMVAIPELDGATGTMVYGGRRGARNGTPTMVADQDRADMLAERVARLASLRKTPVEDRKLAVTLFNFPPNAGAVGTAAYLDVFASLHNLMNGLKADGYTVDVPESAEALRDALIKGNAAKYGTDANVAYEIPVDDHVARETHLAEIEGQWGPAPGIHQTNGQALFVLGAHFGNVFVGLQPAMGYEGDPMRLLFDKGFAPTHAFAAHYRYIRETYQADAVLHFGTHGALEFMPGKQTGLSNVCWPDRLIGCLPNFYLYAANNPSEGIIAKRRSGATLVSYLTPPLKQAGLYKELLALKASIGRWRGLPPDQTEERGRLAELIQTQASALEMTDAEPKWEDAGISRIPMLAHRLQEWEETLIPDGMHVVGETLNDQARSDYLTLIADAAPEDAPDVAAVLARTDRELQTESEIPALLRALDGRFIRPVRGGDLLRTPDILPTGRNIHGFDPFKLPSAFAMTDGKLQADRLIARHMTDHGAAPTSIAMVLWGTDNLKTEGGPIAQALALMGAKPRFDSFGRLAGAELISLEELGRARIDVVMTLSGIFRDLLPLQMKLLAEAAFLAASAADEPLDQNAVRRNALQQMEEQGVDLETAALRVFSNADGAYGSNVNHLIDNGQWSDEAELGDMFAERKCFAYGRSGAPVRREALFKSMLGTVDAAYQNLESVEAGVTTLDHYFDTLGGIAKAATQSGRSEIPVYIGDQTRSDGTVRALSEQVGLETRTRILNPNWYEGMLAHGYEGVRQIEAHITNTVGWSATTGQVDPWIYRELTETFVLDEEMRNRLADLNTKASARLANRLLEAHERNYWTPDEETLNALRQAGDELEDKLEGVGGDIAA